MNRSIPTHEIFSDQLWLLALAEECMKRARTLCDTHDALVAAGDTYPGLCVQQTENLKYGVMTAICVVYAKPFTNNGARNAQIRLNKADVIEKQDHRLHNALMEARHNVFAHQNPERLPFAFRIGGLDSQPSLLPLADDLVLDDSQIPAIRALSERVDKRIQRKFRAGIRSYVILEKDWGANIVVRPKTSCASMKATQSRVIQ